MTVDKDKQVARPTDRIRALLDDPITQDQFKRAMAEHSDVFMASILELVATDSGLQECAPALIIKEALKVATLDIPLSKALGFAYILPFNVNVGDRQNPKWQKVPQFIPGYKLYIQLALRTNQYTDINADVVYEGQVVDKDTLTGRIKISGEPTGANPIGYVAYIELKSGFKHAKYMSVAEITRHAERFSKSYDNKTSPWKTDFDAMAMKTVLKAVLSGYGPLSVRSTQYQIMAGEDEMLARANMEAQEAAELMDPPPAPEPVPALTGPPPAPF